MKQASKWLKGVAPGLLLLLVSFLTACGPTSDAVSSQVKGPRASYATDAVDFGRIPLGQGVSHTFFIKNTGGASLDIKEVKLDLVEGC